MPEVRLIGITQPIIEGVKDANDLVAYAARVSNPSNQMNTETAPRLVNYLIHNSHWSPFEMVSLTMEIKTTRDIVRQILRHRSFSFQEFSQRYAVADNFEFREARLQDQKNRQNSIDINNKDEAQRRLNEDFRMRQVRLLNEIKDTYDWALSKGIAKEQARSVLPEGLTGSTLYMAGTLRSWIHFIEIRTDKATQKEHREVAEQCKNVVLNSFPTLADYFSKDN
jgi:thymidylate synthase (FAD)